MRSTMRPTRPKSRLVLTTSVGLVSLALSGCDNPLAFLEDLKGTNPTTPGPKDPDPKDGPPKPEPPPPGPSCSSQTLGSDSSCKDTATWKQYAYEACSTSGLVLTDYKPFEVCGEGRFRYVEAVCCKPAAPPVPDSCTNEKQGSDSSCKPVATWKQYAYDACVAAGLTLGNYKPVEECGNDSFRYVEYTCCKPAAPIPTPTPTPNPGCSTATQGGPSSCKSAVTWKTYAGQACEDAGLVLTAYQPIKECGEGVFQAVEYTCCKPGGQAK